METRREALKRPRDVFLACAHAAQSEKDELLRAGKRSMARLKCFEAHLAAKFASRSYIGVGVAYEGVADAIAFHLEIAAVRDRRVRARALRSIEAMLKQLMDPILAAKSMPLDTE